MATSNQQRSIKNIIIIGLSGTVGAIFAVLADLTQKQEASAILKIANALETAFIMDSTPVLFTMIVVVGLAVALCFIFEVSTKKNAFYTGVSILSIMMTMVPYKSPPSLLLTRLILPLMKQLSNLQQHIAYGTSSLTQR